MDDGLAKLMELMGVLQMWLWPVVIISLLAVVAVVAQFVNGQRANYWIPALAVHIGVARFLVLMHTTSLRLPWRVSMAALVLWGAYYVLLIALLGAYGLRVRSLWSTNGWFSRTVLVSYAGLAGVFGFLTVFQPYRIILR